MNASGVTDDVLNRHAQAHWGATLIENVRRLRILRDAKEITIPHLPFFHDDVIVESETPGATRNWPDID